MSTHHTEGIQWMKSVTTALTVLELVASKQPVGVSELARLTAQPKSTVQRSLSTLAATGWIERDELNCQSWITTGKLLTLAVSGGALDLREQAAPVMRELMKITQENVHLSIRSGNSISIIDKLECEQVVRLFDPIGEFFPIHACSTGKAILAWTDEEEVGTVIAAGLENFTDGTITDPDEFRRELAAIRDRGYAVNLGEWRSEVRGIAAPVLTAGGRPRAAISIAVPAHRLPEDSVKTLGPIVASIVGQLKVT
jgi:IclR family acetate operon transcriptional repressor